MRVVMIEADEAAGKLLRFVLSQAEHRVVHVTNTTDALKEVLLHETDAVLMEANLPNEDGFELCAALRAGGYQGPVLFVSERIETEDKLAAFAQGADDYIVKPFSPSQLVARVRAVLRRAGVVETPSILTVGDLTLDRSRSEVQRPDSPPLRLTQLEVRLLAMLMLNAGQVLTSDQLITTVWGADGGDRAMLKQLVYRLRTKLEASAAQPPIETIPNIGYTLPDPARS